MFRRALTALLAAAIAMPAPALAAGHCRMAARTLPAVAALATTKADDRCACCDREDAAPKPDCHAAIERGCNCEVRSDTGSRGPAPATSQAVTPSTIVIATILPAAISTPQRTARFVRTCESPPGTGAVPRPQLCSWIL